MPSAAEVRSLFRSFLREGKRFPNYNIREYILRRSRQGFRAAAGEQDETALGRLWAAAKADYEAMKRQSTVYELYGRKMKNVLELDFQIKDASGQRSFATSAFQ